MNRNSKLIKKHYAWREAEKERLRKEKSEKANAEPVVVNK